jgi:hypothetical protein
MKNMLTLLLFLSLLSAFSQEKRIDKKLIPEQVKNYLQLNYPSVKGIEYFKKRDKDSLLYEVEFKSNKQEYNLRFSLKGNLVEVEREIEFDEIQPSLQQIIKSTLSENFRKAKIKKTQEVDPVGTKRIEVYIKVEKSDKFKAGFYTVMFDGSGKLISIEEEKLYSIESVF